MKAASVFNLYWILLASVGSVCIALSYLQQPEVQPLTDSRAFVQPIHTYLYEGQGGTGEAPGYMEIVIPLNPAGSDVYTLTEHKWTDFEFKISFVTNSTQPFNMVYYWQSQGDPWDGNNSEYGDTDARCYFIDDHKTGDVREWSIYRDETPGVTNTMSLAAQCISPNSLIDTVILYPSHESCGIDWTTWQWYTNACNLRASWIRYDELGPELNAAGAERWQPIEIRWVNKRQTED